MSLYEYPLGKSRQEDLEVLEDDPQMSRVYEADVINRRSIVNSASAPITWKKIPQATAYRAFCKYVQSLNEEQKNKMQVAQILDVLDDRRERLLGRY